MATPGVKPAKAPRTKCPFTAEPIQIRQLAGGLAWQAYVHSEYGGWSTSIFSDKEELEYFLGFKDGLKPAYPKHVNIEVKERVPPSEDPTANDAAKERALNESANAIVENIVRGAGK